MLVYVKEGKFCIFGLLSAFFEEYLEGSQGAYNA